MDKNRLDFIITLKKEGKTYEEIGESLGISKQRVYAILKENLSEKDFRDTNFWETLAKQKGYSSEYDMWKDMVKKRLSFKEMSKILDIEARKVWYRLRKHGFDYHGEREKQRNWDALIPEIIAHLKRGKSLYSFLKKIGADPRSYTTCVAKKLEEHGVKCVTKRRWIVEKDKKK